MTARVGLLSRVERTGIPVLLARLAVGGMFLYLSLLKISHPVKFLKDLGEYGVLPVEPPQIVNYTAVIVPFIELVCAIALLLGVWRRGAAAVVTGMLLFFTPLLLWRAGQLYATAQYSSFCGVCFDCGCGTGVVCICHKVAENLALLVGAFLALFGTTDPYSMPGWLRSMRPLAAPLGAAEASAGS